MIKIFCEGKYDAIYVNRLVSYYNLSEHVNIEFKNGKSQVLGEYKKNDQNQFYIIDFDNGLNRLTISGIKFLPNNFAILKLDMEHFFFGAVGGSLTNKGKQLLSEEFRDYTDLELSELISNVHQVSSIDIIVEDLPCSNILMVFEYIKSQV